MAQSGDIAGRYASHFAEASRAVERALASSAEAGTAFGGIVFHAGAPGCYHADDIEIPFRPTPHFARFAPIAGPHHLLCLRPGSPPLAARVVERDFWAEPPTPPPAFVTEVLEWHEAAGPEEARSWLGNVSDCAFVGGDAATATALGIERSAIEPPALMASLDWDRGSKTGFEVACIRAAVERAAAGHAAAREAVSRGRAEHAVHLAYLDAAGLLEAELPYPNILAWNRASAVLHATRKPRSMSEPARNFLIDAGASHLGYACDVTRTYPGPAAPAEFAALVDGMEALQRRLVGAVAPGVSFIALHDEAVAGVAALLAEAGLLRIGVDEAVDRGIAQAFLPHGLGHHLGLQVHDVGGRQQDRSGRLLDPGARSPALRTTRPLAPGHVVTIEPGLYFIPELLGPLRDGPERAALDWQAIEPLAGCGGIRIEDDVLVTETGSEDLSRPLIPGHRP